MIMIETYKICKKNIYSPKIIDIHPTTSDTIPIFHTNEQFHPL